MEPLPRFFFSLSTTCFFRGAHPLPAGGWSRATYPQLLPQPRTLPSTPTSTSDGLRPPHHRPPYSRAASRLPAPRSPARPRLAPGSPPPRRARGRSLSLQSQAKAIDSRLDPRDYRAHLLSTATAQPQQPPPCTPCTSENPRQPPQAARTRSRGARIDSVRDVDSFAAAAAQGTLRHRLAPDRFKANVDAMLGNE